MMFVNYCVGGEGNSRVMNVILFLRFFFFFFQSMTKKQRSQPWDRPTRPLGRIKRKTRPAWV